MERSKPWSSRHTPWFVLSLAVAACYGGWVLHQAFASAYVVQDDARQHVFWMQRFLDPDRFPNDLIADYFQSVAPWGYTHFYRLFAVLGLAPALLAKLLPIVLGLVAAVYGYWLGVAFLPVPLTGFLSSLLIEQILWAHDDLASASPRAFMPPIFLAFLYYLLHRRLWPCLGAIALEGLFYPQYVFVFAGLLLIQLVQWQGGKLTLSRSKRDYGFCGAGLLVAVLVLLPYALSNSDYGPTITAEAARSLAEFNANGRSQFFSDDPLNFWLLGDRSGLFPDFRPVPIALGLLLPLVLRWHLPLQSRLTPQIQLLPQISLVAVGLFSIAHLLLFKLHLPSRYSAYTLRFVLAFALAIGLTLVADASWRRYRSRTVHQSGSGSGSRSGSAWGPILGIVGTAIVGVALLIYPQITPDFPKTNYLEGATPQLYQFFTQQPTDSLIASVLKEIDDVPTFAGRSILIGREYAIPYHVGYATQFRQRVIDLVQAQYTRSRAELAAFIRTYGVDFWVVHRAMFQPSFLPESWIRQYPEAIDRATESLQRGRPVLARMMNRCTVFQSSEADLDLLVLQTDCILQAIESRNVTLEE